MESIQPYNMKNYMKDFIAHICRCLVAKEGYSPEPDQADA